MTADNVGIAGLPAALDAPGAASTPSYRHQDVTAGIAHIGVGNFHRVHEALYVDDLMDAHPDQRCWGIVGIGLQDSPASRAKADAFAAQQGYYTATICASDGRRTARVVASLVDYLYGPADPEAVIVCLADPAIKIVSLTVTEGGYHLDEGTGAFRVDLPEIAADLAARTPTTTFGVLTEALRRRREAGTPPFTVLSCDNLRGNGDTARRATLGFAQARDPELAAWIDAHVAFPNSMVDRIAPVVGAEVRADLNAGSGIADLVPVLAEEFTQWVVEDSFPAGRPRWEDVGVQVRDDVPAFEAIKTRMLNASHVLLATLGAVHGYATIAQSMADPDLARLLEVFLTTDAMPRIDAPSDVSLSDYRDSVLDRFRNPHIPDTVLRVSGDDASKIPVFHRVTCERLMADGGDLRREALMVASFRRHMRGVTTDGRPYELFEPHLTDADWALVRSDDELDALACSVFAGWGLADDARFVATYREAVRVLDAEGVPAAARWAVA